jgi:PAS domain S-box-containing protein
MADDYRRLFETNSVPMCVFANDTLAFLAVNETAVRQYGYSKKEFLSMTVRDIRSPEDVSRFLNHFHSDPPGVVGVGVWRHQKKDGTIIDAAISYDPILWMGSQARLVSARDVTEQKRLEEAFWKSEERFRTAPSYAAAGFAVTDKDGRFINVNYTYCGITGYSIEELCGMDVRDLMHSENLREYSERTQHILTGEINNFIHRTSYIKKSGDLILVQNRVSAIRDHGGLLVGFMVWTEGINDRTVMEIELRKEGALANVAQDAFAVRDLEESLRLFRELMDQSNDAIEIIDPETLRFLDGNEKSYVSLGYTRQEFLSLAVYDVNPTLDESTRKNRRDQLKTTGSLMLESFHRRKDGSTFPVEANLKFVRLDRDYVVAVVRDVTERKQAERELRKLSGRLLRLQDEERRRIARDLHDSTGQDLVALVTMLSQLRALTRSRRPKSRDLVSECQALAERCVNEIRTLSYLLHPQMLDVAGLKDAISHYLDGFTKRSGIRVEFEVSPGFGRMTRHVELALFRVVQESLTNVQRHSGSLQAKIRLLRKADEVTLEIIDNGRESSNKELKRDKWLPFEVGVGIPSMQERVKIIGGRLAIASGSHGTTVRVTLTARAQRHEAPSNSDS